MERDTRERSSRTRQSLRRGMPAALFSILSVWIGVGGVQAQDIAGTRFTVRGFGTLGATTHDADGIGFRRNVGQAESVEARKIDFDIDSLAGAQFEFKVNSK